MKNNLDYYPHKAESHNHPKFKTLRAKYGWEGEGRFWALNNMIASADNCLLYINREYNFSTIAVDLNMPPEDLKAFIKYLEKPCHLIIRKGQAITTEIVQDRLASVMKDRHEARKRKKRRGDGSVELFESSGELEDHSDEPNDKVKDSKVNERKVNLKDVQAAVAKWNKICGKLELRPVELLSDTRIKNVKAKLLNPMFDFDKIISEIEQSDFLTGRTKGQFKVTFDWIFSYKNNFIKIMEGNYRRGNRKSFNSDNRSDRIKSQLTDAEEIVRAVTSK